MLPAGRLVTPSRRAPIAALAAALVTTAAARPAGADSVFFEHYEELSGGFLRRLPPTLSLGATTASDLRGTITAGDLHLDGGATATIGYGAGIRLVIKDRVVIPLMGFAGSFAVGGSRGLITSIDGSIAEVHPWSLMSLGFILPGIGVRMKHRRFQFDALLEGLFQVTNVDVEIASGRTTNTVGASTWNVALLVDLEGCYRIGAIRRACVFARPAVYQFGWWNGVDAGLRMEWGP